MHIQANANPSFLTFTWKAAYYTHYSALLSFHLAYFGASLLSLTQSLLHLPYSHWEANPGLNFLSQILTYMQMMTWNFHGFLIHIFKACLSTLKSVHSAIIALGNAWKFTLKAKHIGLCCLRFSKSFFLKLIRCYNYPVFRCSLIYSFHFVVTLKSVLKEDIGWLVIKDTINWPCEIQIKNRDGRKRSTWTISNCMGLRLQMFKKISNWYWPQVPDRNTHKFSLNLCFKWFLCPVLRNISHHLSLQSPQPTPTPK